MSTLSLGTKRRVINSLAKHPVRVYTNAEGSDIVQIEGFGNFDKGTISSPRVDAARPAKLHEVVIPDTAFRSEGLEFGTIINVQIDFTTSGWSMEFARYGDSYGKPKNFQLMAIPGISLNEMLSQVILSEIMEDGFDLLTVSRGMDLSLGNITTLKAKRPGISFRVKASYDDGQTVMPPVFNSHEIVTYSAFEGLNTYEQLRTIVLQNDTTVAPYSQQGLQLPVEDGMYTSIQFTANTWSPELSTSAAASSDVYRSNKFQLYVLENEANAVMLQELITAIKGNLPMERYDSTGNPVNPLTGQPIT